MFERFTAKARRTIVSAQEEARNLGHNYIGTEHILLGLISEEEGIGARVLAQFSMTLEGARQEVAAFVGSGPSPIKSGHIPFTPRAKKVLELALREALALHHNYIGTEHILLGLIREDDGVAAQVMRKHADLLQVRTAVLDLVQTFTASEAGRRSWLRRVVATAGGRSSEGSLAAQAGAGAEAEAGLLNATPAADATLTTAASLAGADAVGSHHLLLAALTDSNSAAARVLASLGVDLNRAKDALHHADVTGTSDELPEESGRRQLTLQVSDELVTIVAADEALVKAANAALKALGAKVTPGATIRGADLTGLPAASLAKAWTALHDALSAITTRATPEQPTPEQPATKAEASAEDGDEGEAAADEAAG